MQEDINQNLQKLSTWKRIFFMAIFAVIVSLVQIVLQLIILLQIASMLMTGNPNTNILSFGKKTLNVPLRYRIVFNFQQRTTAVSFFGMVTG